MSFIPEMALGIRITSSTRRYADANRYSYGSTMPRPIVSTRSRTSISPVVALRVVVGRGDWLFAKYSKARCANSGAERSTCGSELTRARGPTGAAMVGLRECS